MRKYTITLTEPGQDIWDADKVTVHEVVAGSMKTLDKAVVLMDWNSAAHNFHEVASFSYGDGVSIAVTSTNVE